MAKRAMTNSGITPTGTADAAALLDNTFLGCLLGASATQRTNVSLVHIGGLASSTAPTPIVLARDSTIAVTLVAGTGFRDAPLDPETAALAAPVVVGNSAATDPQRSATLHLLELALNAYGGIAKWECAPGSEISMVGATASIGQMSLSAFTGGTPGLVSSNLIYETL